MGTAVRDDRADATCVPPQLLLGITEPRLWLEPQARHRSADLRATCDEMRSLLLLKLRQAADDGRTNDFLASLAYLPLIFVSAVGSIVYASQSPLNEHFKCRVSGVAPRSL